MEMSLDPEVSMAQTLCLATGVPFDSLISGVIDHEGNFMPPDRDGHADQRIGGNARVYAWRRFLPAARKARELMARNSQAMVYRRPHFYHGDHEALKNFWVEFHVSSDQQFDARFPWQSSPAEEHGQMIQAAVQARSEREAIDFLFGAFRETPRFVEVRNICHKPNDWQPFASIQQRSWMQWRSLAVTE